MDAAALARELAAIERRAPCTDAERRAARVLARELRARGRAPRTETVWVRPGWPGVWLLYAVLGVAGSVASVDYPAVGLGVLAVAAAAALADLSGRMRALSALAPKRATQNVVAEPPERPPAHEPLWGPGAAEAATAAPRPRPVTLVIAAGYDAARVTPPTTQALGAVERAARRALGGRLAHPLGLLALTLALLAALAGARLAGVEGTVLGAVQLVPTVVAILATALLAEVAFAEPTSGAHAHASAAAAALAVAEALDRAPPRNLAVEVVLAGAADAHGQGMRAYVRARGRRRREEDVAVLHLEPCGAGTPAYWTHDGPLYGARLHPQLVRLAREAAAAEGHLGARPHRGHGLSGALQARRGRWPAIAIGCRPPRGAPSEDVDPAAMRGAVELAVALVRRLDRELGSSGR